MVRLSMHVTGSLFRTLFVKYYPKRMPLSFDLLNCSQITSNYSNEARSTFHQERHAKHISIFSFNQSNSYSDATSKKKEEEIRLPNNTVKEKEERVWTVPNLLCMARIVSAPFLGYFILTSNNYISLSILIGSALTDFADGLIARNFAGQSSKLGTFLDPLADKILLVTLYACLTYTHAIPGILAALVILRDVLLLAAGFTIRYVSLPPPKTVKKMFSTSHSEAQLFPTYLSKINTVVQLFTAVISLLAQPSTWIPENLLLYSWYAAGCSTILSGLSYLIKRDTFLIPSKHSSSVRSAVEKDPRRRLR